MILKINSTRGHTGSLLVEYIGDIILHILSDVAHVRSRFEGAIVKTDNLSNIVRSGHKVFH